MCFPHEASGQGHGVCVMVLFLIDVFILVWSAVFAVIERGTVTGWVCAALVVWQVRGFISYINENSFTKEND